MKICDFEIDFDREYPSLTCAGHEETEGGEYFLYCISKGSTLEFELVRLGQVLLSRRGMTFELVELETGKPKYYWILIYGKKSQ